MIKKDKKGAADIYLSMVKERASAEEIVQLLTQGGAIYQAEPRPHDGLCGQGRVHQADTEELERLLFPAPP